MAYNANALAVRILHAGAAIAAASYVRVNQYIEA